MLKKFITILIVAIFFAITRWKSIHQLPIINDEPLYVQYMQQINLSFQENKRISVDNIYKDRKPPLQYRIGSNTINTFRDPILGARLSSLLIGLAGLIGVMILGYSMTNGIRGGLLTGIIYTLNPTSISNSTFVLAEGLVSVLFLYIIILLIGFYRQHRQNKLTTTYITAYFIVYIILAYALLMSKQTGDLLILIATLAQFIIFIATYYNQYKKLPQRQSYIGIIKYLCLFFIGSIISYFLYKYTFPGNLYTGKQLFGNIYGYTFTIGELLKLPVKIRFYNGISGRGYIRGMYKTQLLILFVTCAYSIWKTIKQKPTQEITQFAVYLSMLLLISLSFVFLVKNFAAQGQKIIQYSAEIASISISLGLIILRSAITKTKYQYLFIVSTIFIFGGWLQNIRISTWGVYDYNYSYAYKTQQCLEAQNCNWGSQVDMEHMSQKLQMLNQSLHGGCLFTDPQWGHPGTLVKVQQNLYPTLQWKKDIPSDKSERPETLSQCEHNILVFDSKRNDRGLEFEDQRGKKLLDSDYCKNQTNRTKNNSSISQITICIYSPHTQTHE